MEFRTIKLSDAVGGMVFLTLGLTVAFYAPSLNRSGGVGGGTFPLAIGILLSISGGGILIGAVFNSLLSSVSSRPTTDAADADEVSDVRSLPITWSISRIAPILIIPAAIVIYALTVRSTGALVMNFAIVAVVAWVWGLGIGRAIILGIAASAVVYGFFTLAMGVPLPSGVLEEVVRQWT